MKNFKSAYDGEAMSVCMLIPRISGRITMKHGAVLLVTAPCCRLVGGYQRFGGTFCLHLLSPEDLDMQYALPKRRYLFM